LKATVNAQSIIRPMCYKKINVKNLKINNLVLGDKSFNTASNIKVYMSQIT